MARVRDRGFDDGPAVPPPRLRAGRGRSRTPPGRITLAVGLIGILITFGAGIAGFVTAVAPLPYRAGWAGTAGTASLVSCQEFHSGRSAHVDCVGRFTATDGSVTPLTDVEGDTALGGRDYPARLHPGGATMSIVSTATVLFSLAGVFGSLILVILLGGFGTLIVVAAVRRRSGLPVLRAKKPVRVLLIATGVAAVTAFALSIAGSAIGV
jgi:hypothetical protein